MLILLLFTVRSIAAFGLSWSWAKTLAPASVMAYPKGDRELFEPGAAALIRIVAEQRHEISHLVCVDVCLGLAMMVVGAVLTTLVLTALASSPKSAWTLRARAALRATPSIIGITVAYWLFLAVVLYLARLVVRLIPAAIYPIAGEKGSDVAFLVLAAAIVGVAYVALVAVDLARAATVSVGLNLTESLSAAAACLKTQPRVCLVYAAGWIAPALVGPAILEFLLSHAHSMARGQLLLSTLIHQTAIGILCTLHLWWWLKAIDLVQVPKKQTPNAIFGARKSVY